MYLLSTLQVEFVGLFSTGNNEHIYIYIKYYLIFYSTASIRLWCIVSVLSKKVSSTDLLSIFEGY